MDTLPWWCWWSMLWDMGKGMGREFSKEKCPDRNCPEIASLNLSFSRMPYYNNAAAAFTSSNEEQHDLHVGTFYQLSSSKKFYTKQTYGEIGILLAPASPNFHPGQISMWDFFVVNISVLGNKFSKAHYNMQQHFAQSKVRRILKKRKTGESTIGKSTSPHWNSNSCKRHKQCNDYPEENVSP